MRDEERAWIAQRDKTCAPDDGGGTASMLDSNQCQLDQTAAPAAVKEYLDKSPYRPPFQRLMPVTPAFDAKWQELARTDPGFGQDQHDFVGRSRYTAQVRALQARGLDLSGRGMAVYASVPVAQAVAQPLDQSSPFVHSAII